MSHRYAGPVEIERWPCGHPMMSHYTSCCDCESELLEEINRLRAVLAQIAEAAPDEAESQAPWWAAMAICSHPERQEDRCGEHACIVCGQVDR